jgi:hypothetical protein
MKHGNGIKGRDDRSLEWYRNPHERCFRQNLPKQPLKISFKIVIDTV